MCDYVANTKTKLYSVIDLSYLFFFNKTIDFYSLMLGFQCKRRSVGFHKRDRINLLVPTGKTSYYLPLQVPALFLLIVFFLTPFGTALAEDNCPMIADSDQADFDSDSVGDACDNCLLRKNPDQQDTDADGFGNMCDGDFDNNNIVNSFDSIIFRNALFSKVGEPNYNPLADFNSDGIINRRDSALFRRMLFNEPGPTGVTAKLDNHQPKADAGPDQTTAAGQTVNLDATGSTDIDGGPLSYLWSFISIPSGSTAILSDQRSVRPTFTTDLPDNYELQLDIWDGTANSIADTLIISAINSPPVANAGADQTIDR